MKRHLTEEELIGLQFKLLNEADALELREHLDECARCKQELSVLKRKFSTLDALRGDVDVSENAVAELMLRVKAEPTKILRFPTWLVALSGAAALILFLLVLGPWRNRQGGLGIGEGDDYVEVADADEVKALRAEDAFLPGSNIELNVLPTRDGVQVTIYNSADLTLVRERRDLTLKKGWNWLQFMWANTLIDPTSLSMQPLKHRDKIEVQELTFPPRVRELGRWLIFSQVSGKVPMEITYLTSGLSWRAFYMGTLARDEKTMQLQGYVRVTNNSGEDYEDAQTRLIVGQVHLLDQIADLARRKYPYSRPLLSGWGEGGGDTGLVGGLYDDASEEQFGFDADGNGSGMDDYAFRKPKEIKKEGLSEYFLYTIEGTETIPNGWGKRLPSFDFSDIPVVSLYKYDEEQYGSEPVRFVAFANDEDHKLGQTPIPNGRIRIYRYADAEQYLSYVGGSEAKYIPIDEDIELNLGPARQIKVEPNLMEYRTENFMYDNNGNINGWDEIRTWKLELANTRELRVKLELTRGFGTAYWALETGRQSGYEKHDATHARFTVELKPRSKLDLEYTVRTYHGTREQAAR